MRFNEVALMVPCAKCKVGVDEKCRTRSGNIATLPHGARLNPLYEVWRDSYFETEYDMAKDVLEAWKETVSSPDRFNRLIRQYERIVSKGRP